MLSVDKYFKLMLFIFICSMYIIYIFMIKNIYFVQLAHVQLKNGCFGICVNVHAYAAVTLVYQY